MKIGDQLPKFKLNDSNHSIFEIEQHAKGKNVVVFFYPKDFTPTCTKQVCGFRDNFSEFQNLNSLIIGINEDSPETHKKFKEKHQLPFTLLSDPKGEVRKLFGLKKILGFTVPRYTFIFNENGTLLHKYKGILEANSHIQESLNALKK